MTKALNLTDRFNLMPLVHGVVDDFPAKDTNVWTTTATDSGTAAVGDAAGGVVTLAPSDGTVADNDEVYLLTKELYKIVSGKPIKLLAYVKFTEANTDDANVFVGLMDGVAADSIVDNGAGPKTSFSGAGFFKVDGGTTWKVIYSDGSTQTIKELTADISYDGVLKTAGGSSYQKLEIEIVPHTSTACDITFMIDDVVVYKMKDKTYASATEMSLVVGAKNGGANNESILVDYIGALQKR